MKVDAVIVAAGSSTRFGTEDKLFADLCGRPLVAWSLAAYAAANHVERITLVCTPENIERMHALGQRWAPERFASAVAGGLRRRDSVEAGLHVSTSRYVAIHDGARPLATPDLIDRCIEVAQNGDGAIVATPVTDTIKLVSGTMITGHPDRSLLWAAQTPQVVLRQAWLTAASMGDNDETDDAAMLSRLGLECAVVEGDPQNIKVTRLLDLEIARLILQSRAAR